MNVRNTIYDIIKSSGQIPKDFNDLFERIKNLERIESELTEYLKDCDKSKAIPKLYRLNKILTPEFK